MEPNQQVEGMIGMACGETARYSTSYASLMGIEKPAGTVFLQCVSMSVADNFNKIAREFLKTSGKWLFLVNDDQIWAPNTLKKLLAHDKDVVTGLYLARTFPFAPVIHDQTTDDGRIFPRYLERNEHGLVPIKACGDGCLLIKRKVLEAIADPWWELGIPESDKCGHDVLLSKKINDAGFQIWADLECLVGHLGLFSIFPRRMEDGNWQTLVTQGNQALFTPAAQSPLNPFSFGKQAA